MSCDDVIRELAAPTEDRDRAAIDEHLARCTACAEWARRAARLDQLWEETRPIEPSPEAWGRVWAGIARALDPPAAIAVIAPGPARISWEGTHPKVVVHPAPASIRPATHSRTWRLAAVALVGLASAAAILISAGAPWYAPSPNQPTQTPDPVLVPVALPVKIEEGHVMVICMERQTRQVLLPILAPGFSSVFIRAEGQVSRVTDLTLGGEPHSVDDWYVVFNTVESIDHPVIASR